MSRRPQNTTAVPYMALFHRTRILVAVTAACVASLCLTAIVPDSLAGSSPTTTLNAARSRIVVPNFPVLAIRPTPAMTANSTLTAAQSLCPSGCTTKRLVAPNGKFRAFIQSGTVKVQNAKGQTTWSLATASPATAGIVTRVSMTPQGQLSIRGSRFSVATPGAGNVLVLTNGGSLEIVSAGGLVLWTAPSGLTGISATTMVTGEQLGRGQGIVSPDGNYLASLQWNGAFTIATKSGTTSWTTQSLSPQSFGSTTSLELSPSGNLIANAGGWSTNTAGAGSSVTLSNAGVLAITSPGHRSLWTSTSGLSSFRADQLFSSQTLSLNQGLSSLNDAFHATLLGNGQFVITSATGATTWQALPKNFSNGITQVVVAPSGDVDGAGTTWHTSTIGAGNTLSLTNGGVLQVVSLGGLVLWRSNSTQNSLRADELGPGESLSSGQFLVSLNGQYFTLVQPNGAIQITTNTGTLVWTTNTATTTTTHATTTTAHVTTTTHATTTTAHTTTTVHHVTTTTHATTTTISLPIATNPVLTMSANGNLILSDSINSQVWATGTSGAGNVLSLNNRGLLTVTSLGSLTLWSDLVGGTGQAADRLQVGQSLLPGNSLASANGSYLATLTSSGDLQVIRRSDNAVLWDANTAGKGVSALSMLSNHTLALQETQTVNAFTTLTSGSLASAIVMENSGVLDVVTPWGQAVWNSAKGLLSLVPTDVAVYSYDSDNASAALGDGWTGVGVTGGLGTCGGQYVDTSPSNDRNVGAVLASTKEPWYSFWTVSGPSKWANGGCQALAGTTTAFHNIGYTAGRAVATKIDSYGLSRKPNYVILDPEGYPDNHSGLDASSAAGWAAMLSGWSAGIKSIDSSLVPAFYSTQYEYIHFNLKAISEPAFIAVAFGWSGSSIVNPQRLSGINGSNIVGVSAFFAGVPWSAECGVTVNGRPNHTAAVHNANSVASWGYRDNTIQFDPGTRCAGF